MAKKDFDKYYAQVSSQLYSLQDAFDELSEEVSNGMVEPERIEQMKLTIQPIKDSFQTLSYIKYLLDKPSRKEKGPAYTRRNKKLIELSKGNQAQDIISRNDDIIKGLKSR